jgi:hypothetical protein
MTRDGTVECPDHGSQPPTFVCRHLAGSLRTGRPVGFFHGEDPGNPRPDAWCGACDDRLMEAGGEWTDETEAEAGVTLMCGACYDRVRAMHERGREDGRR